MNKIVLIGSFAALIAAAVVTQQQSASTASSTTLVASAAMDQEDPEILLANFQKLEGAQKYCRLTSNGKTTNNRGTYWCADNEGNPIIRVPTTA